MSILSAGATRAGLSVALLALATLGSAASTASAQSVRLQLNVPFSFDVGSRHLAPGQYTMQLQSDRMLLISGTRDSTFTTGLPNESREAAKASVVIFQRFGNQTFLREIHLAGRSTYLKCAKGRLERRLEVAANTPTPSNVEVASLEASH